VQQLWLLTLPRTSDRPASVAGEDRPASVAGEDMIVARANREVNSAPVTRGTRAVVTRAAGRGRVRWSPPVVHTAVLNGANRFPVASSDPHCGTTNRDKSRGASPSLIMTTQPSVS
jgi:hypothetical protein